LVQAVLLDLGETLVHLDRPWDEVFNANIQSVYGYLSKLGLRLDYNEFAARFIRIFDDASGRADLYKIEIPMEEILSKALRKSGLQVIGMDLPTNAMMEFYRPEVEAWQPYPDTIETLTRLREEGYYLGVISNAKSDWAVRSIVDRRDIGKFVSVVVTSAALRIRKPRPEIFMRALNSLNVKAADSVFVGDSIHADIAGAKSIGMRTIHVVRKPPDSPNFWQPDATVASLSAALETVTTWNNGSAFRPAFPHR
jgi:putative hydrolase of the HAD superfamily